MTCAAGIREHFRASQDNAIPGVCGNTAGYIQRIADRLRKTVEKRSAPRQCNTAVENIGSKLRRCTFNHNLYSLDQIIHLIHNCLVDFIRFNAHRLGQSGNQISACNIHHNGRIPADSTAQGDFDLFSCSFADKHIVLFPKETDDCIVKMITADMDGTDYRYRIVVQNSQVCASGADIHHKASVWSEKIELCAQGSRYILIHQLRPAYTGFKHGTDQRLFSISFTPVGTAITARGLAINMFADHRCNKKSGAWRL